MLHSLTVLVSILGHVNPICFPTQLVQCLMPTLVTSCHDTMSGTLCADMPVALHGTVIDSDEGPGMYVL